MPFLSKLFCSFFLITLQLLLSVWTPFHWRMPSFCRPERLERRLRRANVKIPPSSPLNTRVNNSAQPEQSLNLRVCRALLCTLYFLSPSHKKEQRVGLSLFITDNLSALRLDFQPTTRVSAAQSVQRYASLSPSCWPVGGATWQHIRRRCWRRRTEENGFYKKKKKMRAILKEKHKNTKCMTLSLTHT